MRRLFRLAYVRDDRACPQTAHSMEDHHALDAGGVREAREAVLVEFEHPARADVCGTRGPVEQEDALSDHREQRADNSTWRHHDQPARALHERQRGEEHAEEHDCNE